MPSILTYPQALSLAPDEPSRKNATSLMSSRKWLGLNQSAIGERLVLWGEIQGSGADPYRCQVNLAGPSFACTCPSKKRPCKHALGMLLLFTSQPEQFENCAAPDWIAAWLAKQIEQGVQRAARVQGHPTNPDRTEKEREAAKRAAARDQKIRSGLDELETWLQDLLRQGLASAQTQPKSFWENASARLVDAQAPGLARMVRAMPGLAVSGEGWQDRLLEKAGRLYLAIEGYRRIDSLPQEIQADLRSLVGINLKQEELSDRPGMKDTWLVLGREIEEEAGLKTQRTWLWGLNAQRFGLVLSFSAAGAALDTSLAPGSAFQGELIFYPGSLSLRATLRSRAEPTPILIKNLPGEVNFRDATARFSNGLALYPWLERYPIALEGVIPFREKDTWMLVDCDGRRAAISRQFLHNWTLLSLSGGNPIGIFGEWNGDTFSPLSAWANAEFLAFRPNLE